MKMLIIGATGMLGHRLFLSLSRKHDVWGTVRNKDRALAFLKHFSVEMERLIDGVSADDISKIDDILKNVRPELVVNCIGVIKQKEEGANRISCLKINSLFPHQLAELCTKHSSRMIHFSTDCIFDGKRGNYCEEDTSNAYDLYGRSKFLGEVDYLKNVLTIRSSIIGREIMSRHGLIEWFLSQKNKTVNGFSKAIFSGLPTAYFSHLITEYILQNTNLHGLFHISSNPIDKYNLLKMVAKELKVNIKIKHESRFKVDRSLDSTKFQKESGWHPPSWEELIKWLHEDNNFYRPLS